MGCSLYLPLPLYSKHCPPKQNITTLDAFLYIILLVGPLELHTSLALSHTLSYQQSLHTIELIGHPAVQDQSVWITSAVKVLLRYSFSPNLGSSHLPHGQAELWFFQHLLVDMHWSEQCCYHHPMWVWEHTLSPTCWPRGTHTISRYTCTIQVEVT